MIRKGLTRLLQIVLIPVVCGIIGLVLLAAAFLIPTDRIEKNVRDSVPGIHSESNYFSITPRMKGGIFDNYTDADYLNEALVSTKDAGLMGCIMYGYRFVPEDDQRIGNVELLSKVAESREGYKLSAEYERFFNGYMIVLKPLLLVTNYSGIRQFNMYVGVFLTLAVLYLMLKRGLKKYLLPVTVSLLFLRPLALMASMSFFGFYVCMMVPCIIILMSDDNKLKERLWLLFGLTGALTYYFNMNYIQLLSFGIPMLFFFMVTGVPEKPLELIKTMAYSFFAWGVGLVGMMVFKWLAYVVFIDSGIIKRVVDLFLYRTDTNDKPRLFGIVFNGTSAFGNPMWNALEIAFICLMVITWIKNKKKLRITISEVYLLVLMLCLTIGRYVILSNHVIIHNWVTYRLLMIPILAFNLILAKQACKEDKEEKIPDQGSLL